MSLPYVDMVWSVIRDCGISVSYTLFLDVENSLLPSLHKSLTLNIGTKGEVGAP